MTKLTEGGADRSGRGEAREGEDESTGQAVSYGLVRNQHKPLPVRFGQELRRASPLFFVDNFHRDLFSRYRRLCTLYRFSLFLQETHRLITAKSFHPVLS